jgi:threonine dehydrogenase-like Zn-dependent dehydrogenase
MCGLSSFLRRSRFIFSESDYLMKALCWHGSGDVRVDTVPDAKIEQPTDVVIKITSTAICGSDLHLFDGYQPTMEKGDILGHEPMGVVVEVGSKVTKLKKGDRVVVPFTISCGSCFFCQKTLFSCCDTTNPNAKIAEEAMGHSPAGLFGFSHMLGGYAGGQAEYLRVPHADVGPIKIESGLPDEKVLFLSDIFPTGYMAAENAGIEPGDTVAVWGCGPVAQFAIKSAWMLGAGRVIAIDRVPERLKMAQEHGKAEIINFDKETVYDKLQEMTKGRGPDRCIDAVGCEAHAAGTIDSVLDKAKATVGLTLKSGQTHVQRYLRPLLEKIEKGEIDPSFVITHKLPLADAPAAYKTFRDKKDGCIKVVLKP